MDEREAVAAEYTTCPSCCLDAGFLRRLRRFHVPDGCLLLAGLFANFMYAVFFMVMWSTAIVECKHAQNGRISDFRNAWSTFASRSMNIESAQLTGIAQRKQRQVEAMMKETHVVPEKRGGKSAKAKKALKAHGLLKSGKQLFHARRCKQEKLVVGTKKTGSTQLRSG